MDIEKLIDRLGENTDCWTDKVHGYADLRLEASTALSALQAENEKLRADLEQAKAERDAAISDLETIMAYGGGNLDTCQYCKNGRCYARGGTKLCLPQWRGQKED